LDSSSSSILSQRLSDLNCGRTTPWKSRVTEDQTTSE
jgi:hypothetical protein